MMTSLKKMLHKGKQYDRLRLDARRLWPSFASVRVRVRRHDWDAPNAPR